MVSLRQLKYVHAVAKFGQFGRAANACAVTQPALSMQVQDIEKEWGIQLFERHPRGIRLTEDGREIAIRAGRILNDIQSLTDFAKNRCQPLHARLRLGVIPSIAPYLLPPLLIECRKHYPELDLHIKEHQTSHLLDELDQGDLDLLLLGLPVERSGIKSMPLFDDPFLLAIPEALRKPEEQVSIASLEDWPDQRILLLEEGHCLRDQALSFCGAHYKPGNDAFGASSLATIVQLVSAGMGITLLPQMSVAIEATRGEISLLHFQDPAPSRSIGLAWRQSADRESDANKLGELILAAAQSLTERSHAENPGHSRGFKP